MTQGEASALRGDAARGLAPRFMARLASTEPLVVLSATVPRLPLGPVPALARRLGRRRATSLVFVHWSLETGSVADSVGTQYRAVAAESPAHRVIMLCNTAREVEILRAAGIEAQHCNHNLVVDENVFDLDGQARPDFDAIYVARMHSYKRHELARAVRRLALVYYGVETAEPGYFESVRAALPHAALVNERLAASGYGAVAHERATSLMRALNAQRRYAVLAPAAVAACCNRTLVGLCLSACEGAMYASMEYLLCGLSIVSTPNLGGRDHFFDPEYCITAPPDEAAIAAAVAELVRRAVPREHVRASTLAKVAAERAKLRGILGEVLAAEGAESRLDEVWKPLFVGRWWRWAKIDELIGAAA